jgi:hypothetical protein
MYSLKRNEMKRKICLIEIGVIIFCFFIGSGGNITAQTVTRKSTLGSMEAYDENGKPFATQHNDHIGGSPMLNPDWGSGVVSYKNGKVVSPIQIQFNLQKNELYFQREGKKFMFTDTVSEFRIIFSENDSAISQKFRSGYPSIGKNKSTHFYQVLVDNKTKQLISDRSKKLLDAYTYSGGENSVYREEEVLYLFDTANRKMIEIKNLKNAKAVLTSSFPDHKAEIDRIYAEQKSGIKTREELIALVRALQ